MYWVYILENLVGRFYIGSTDDLSRRVQDHNCCEKVLSKYTHKNGPWHLVWSEKHLTRAEAMQREKHLKSCGGRRFIQELVAKRPANARGC